jgi:peptidyl-prolyl cis-trans isomerase D
MMLQNLRDNLKGTVATIVLIIFVVPLILFGVDQLFVDSAGSSGAGSVNGEEISPIELERELNFERQRRQQQFKLESNSPQLETSVLVGPVLQRMTRRLAIYQAATDMGMGASKDILWKRVSEMEAFQVDGKFNYDLFVERISPSGFTRSTFLKASAQDLVLQHVNNGIFNSAFVTDQEINILSAITKQKRSFFSVLIPKTIAENVSVSDEEVSEFYEKNADNYRTPEELTVEYVELSLESLSQSVDVPQADIKAAYDSEVGSFVADPKYKVAHILLKSKENRTATVSEINQKLAANVDFSDLAKSYSEDLGSKENGGNLGELSKEAFPKAFVEAVTALSVGSVSGAVETDAGIHFIKLLEKTNTEAPSFEDRKDALTRQLKLDSARNLFSKKMEVLGDATFSADSLSQAAEALSLEIKTSKPFGRKATPGVDISSSAEVVAAAYANDVLLEGHNSRVLELPEDRAVVLRLKSHAPEAVKPFVLVQAEIKYQLISDKKSALLLEKANSFKDQVKSSSVAENLSKEMSYTYKLNENATRNSFELGGEVVRSVFALPRPADEGSPVLDVIQTQSGDYAVVGLLSVEDGLVSEMESEQVEALKGQLGYQLAQLGLTAYENSIVNGSKIVLPK